MRVLLAVGALIAALAVSASAAQLDPAKLVLHQIDVPAGFHFTEGGLTTKETQSDEALWALFVRWGRISGYEARFERHGKPSRAIESGAELFRSPQGPRLALAKSDRLANTAYPGSFERARAKVGAVGWVHWWSDGTDRFSVVIWRYDRVYAFVAGWQLTRAQTVALARLQQQRIVAALR